jgi:hypothetical protein
MFAFIDNQNNVIGIVNDAPVFSRTDFNIDPSSSNSEIHQCVEINDDALMNNIISLPVVDENLKPTGNTFSVLPPGWKYVNNTFIFDSTSITKKFPQPVIDFSYPWSPETPNV